MFRQYLFVFSTLFLSIHSKAATSDWEQAKHELHTALQFVHNSNLYFQPSVVVADEKLVASVQYHWLELFEGYAVAVPLSISSSHYADQSGLSSTDHRLAPAVKLFLSDAVDITVQSQWQRELARAGFGKGEFLDPAAQSLTDEHKSLELSLQLGRSPDKQQLTLSAGRDLRQQTIQQQPESQLLFTEAHAALFTSQQGNFVSANYGHRLNENSSLLAQAAIRREQQGVVPSELYQLGAGWSTHYAGSQQFQFVAGQFRRDTAGQQSNGYYWQANNLWQISRQWQLDLVTSRNSVLSYATASVSQLETRTGVTLGYQWNDAHQIALSSSHNKARLDEQQLQKTRLELALRWQWQLGSNWQQQLQLQGARLAQPAMPDKTATELFWQVSRLW
ncbi:hypothetical protein [Rheinheimera sp.]|uniref:hypothetical protein n=1 Tax=Rheinheimera sp. TaxID=1869214 RepID=UPI002FDCECDD